MTTTELLNTLISRAEQDGLPELTELLASSISADDAGGVPLAVIDYRIATYGGACSG